jgi:hypothetical protein
MVGILLRVRWIVFVGIGDLVVAMMWIIGYAAVDLHDRWLVCVTVDVFGVLVVGLFAVFERKRRDVLHTLDVVLQWAASDSAARSDRAIVCLLFVD